MNFIDMIENMPESVYQSILESVETGKWKDGQPLNQAQREQSLRVVMAWQAKHLNSNEHFTLAADGQLNQKSREQFKQDLADKTIIRFKHNDI